MDSTEGDEEKIIITEWFKWSESWMLLTAYAVDDLNLLCHVRIIQYWLLGNLLSIQYLLDPHVASGFERLHKILVQNAMKMI